MATTHSTKGDNPQPENEAGYVTPNPERYSLYRLCECTACQGTGKEQGGSPYLKKTSYIRPRCRVCRGEARVREEIATCGTPEAVGLALVTLAREGEWGKEGENCALGLLDREAGEESTVGKWLIRPWLPSARNVRDAGRTLAKARKT